MSNFVVSARKYRPVRFDEVVGQSQVSKTLKNAMAQDHLAHAFLFCGPRGVGKTTCARILAKVLNCDNRTEDHEPCNTCNSCVAFNENASFNVTELDAASNNSVDHMRSLIEQVRFQPQQGQYKIFIIDEVHMLSAQAFNAFLKTLEEPPSYAIFILATTEKHKIIPTILSRCQIFDFNRIQVTDIITHLESICKEENIEAETDGLHIIAQKADGALRDALSIFDRIVSFSGSKITYDDVILNLNVLDYDYFFKMVDAMLSEDIPEMLATYDTIMKNGFEGDVFLIGLGEHLRNILVCQDPKTLGLLEVGDKLRDRYKEQAMLSDTSILLGGLHLINDCEINYKMARNKRLHVEMGLIKMCHLKRTALAWAGGNPNTEKKTADLSAPSPAAPKTVATTPVVNVEPITQAPNPEPVIEVKMPQTPAASTPIKEDETIAPLPKPTSIPSIASFDQLATSLSKKATEQEFKPLDQVLQEDVETAWNTYAEGVKSKSVKGILTRAKLEMADGKLTITVGANLGKNMILQEKGLIEFLTKELSLRILPVSVEIDDSMAEPVQDNGPKILSAQDKFNLMAEENPNLNKLVQKLDLRPD